MSVPDATEPVPAAEEPKVADATKPEEKKEEVPAAAGEKKSLFPTKPAGKFTLGAKFGGGAFKNPITKPPAEKAAPAKEEATDDSHMEAPSSSADMKDADEGEDKLFNDKAILYRFDKANNEWKERGVGFMRILKNKESKMCRVLMRRNQTFRVCSNHFILPYMELKPNNGSDRALMWNAVDFADGAESHDVLSVKFKSAEIAAAFKKAFDDARAQNEQILKEKEQPKPEEEKKE